MEGTVWKNPCLTHPNAEWSWIWQRDFWGRDNLTSPLSHKSWRPLTTATYKLQWVNKQTVYPYHVVNVVLHGITSALCVPVRFRAHATEEE